jgi:class 3 adenylate cyclase
MKSDRLIADIEAEVKTILSADFRLSVSETQLIPHSSDGAITFPNLDDRTQGVKLLETAVLYVDMRGSTKLSLRHRPETMAKLYSAFVRAMTRCATASGGQVRGIIGDRVMVLFEPHNCFAKAVDTAELMSQIGSNVLNKQFQYADVKFGFGIDFGKMLVTKTGIRKHGAAQQSYRSLVWLGRPANVASKLTDNANKPAETFLATLVRVAYVSSGGLTYREEWPSEFAKCFWHDANSGLMRHTDANFHSFEIVYREKMIRDATPQILMTERVYDGYLAARPDSAALRQGRLRPVFVEIAGYNHGIYGLDAPVSDADSQTHSPNALANMFAPSPPQNALALGGLFANLSAADLNNPLLKFGK